MKILLNYGYPGNVRELENILEHALITCQQNTLQPRHLPEYLLSPQKSARPATPITSKRFADSGNSESDKILAALEANDWRRVRAARALGIDRTTLWRKMKKYGFID